MVEVDGCLGCDGANPVVWLITCLNPPMTIRSCEQDIEMALLTILAQRWGVEAGALAEHTLTYVDLATAPVQEEPAKPKRGRPRKAAPAEPSRPGSAELDESDAEPAYVTDAFEGDAKPVFEDD